MYIFAKAMSEGLRIRLFNYGRMRRDFASVDVVVEARERYRQAAGAGRFRARQWPRSGEKCRARSARLQHRKQQHGRSFLLVELLEREFGRKAETELVPMQPGDVPETYADVADLMRQVGFRPSPPIEQVVNRFVSWFREYHSI
jgi:UDP-glucuronate 4-epimerase